jgi:hypothetical protein
LQEIPRDDCAELLYSQRIDLGKRSRKQNSMWEKTEEDGTFAGFAKKIMTRLSIFSLRDDYRMKLARRYWAALRRKTMRKNNFGAIAIQSFTLLILLGIAVLCAAYQAMAQDAKTLYPNMAPVEQYLMERTAEIALARTAAPESVAGDADVLVLGRHGFETAVKGKNGFVCIVERSWTSAADADFWNPKVRTPICYNAAAAHSLLLRNMKRTELILAGRTQAQVDEAIFSAVNQAAVDKKELPAIEPGAMCYMMSKLGYGGDSVPHWPAHVMFFYSGIDPATWGANLPGSPIMAVSDVSQHPSEHLTEFAVGVQRWSDGTEAPMHHE